MPVANQYGIDLPSIYQSANAFQDAQQQREANALSIQKTQMDLDQAPQVNALALQEKRQNVQKGALDIAGEQASQQRDAATYKVQQLGKAFGSLKSFPKEQRAQAWDGISAQLKESGIDLPQVTDFSDENLNSGIKNAQTVEQQLAQVNADRTYDAGRTDAANTQKDREATAAREAANALIKPDGTVNTAYTAAKAAEADALLPSKIKLTQAEAAAKANAEATALGPVSNLTGADYLKTLNPGIAGQVQMLAEGKLAIPTGAALRAPYWQNLIQAAHQYDPSLDQASAGARFATRKAFSAGGTESKTINNLNTAIGHAGTLLDQISGTFSGPSPILNGIANFASTQTGHAGPTLFKDTAGKLAEELTAVYRNGGGAEKDVVRALQSMTENASDDTKRAVLGNTVDLLQSKMDALGDQYNRGMGTTKEPLELLNAHAQATFKKLRGGGQTAQSEQAAPASKFVEGQTYKDANGKMATYRNGQFVEHP